MDLKIAVCDDVDADRDYIAALAERWAAKAGYGAQISSFVSAESFLFQYEDRSDHDILLLDVEMGGMDGVTLAKKLRQGNETVQIVFITGYSDYIAEGYEVAALHYLMKPVDERKLFSVLDRAVEKLRKDEKALTVESGGATVRIPVRQIRWACEDDPGGAGRAAGRPLLPGGPVGHRESDADQPGDPQGDRPLGRHVHPVAQRRL